MNTQDYRLAPGGEGPHADTWNDKPHRLIYDLCGEIERLQAANVRINTWFDVACVLLILLLLCL